MLTARTAIANQVHLDIEEDDRREDRYKSIHAHGCGGVVDPEPIIVTGGNVTSLLGAVDGYAILDSCVDVDDELATVDALLMPCARRALGLN